MDPTNGTVIMRTEAINGTTIESARVGKVLMWHEQDEPTWDYTTYARFVPMLDSLTSAAPPPHKVANLDEPPLVWTIATQHGSSTSITQEELSAATTAGEARTLPYSSTALRESCRTPTLNGTAGGTGANSWLRNSPPMSPRTSSSDEATLVHSTAFHPLAWRTGIPVGAHLDAIDMPSVERAFAAPIRAVYGNAAENPTSVGPLWRTKRTRAVRASCRLASPDPGLRALHAARLRKIWLRSFRWSDGPRWRVRKAPAFSPKVRFLDLRKPVARQLHRASCRRPTHRASSRRPIHRASSRHRHNTRGLAAVKAGLAIGGAIGYYMYLKKVEPAFARLGQTIKKKVEDIGDMLDQISPAPLPTPTPTPQEPRYPRSRRQTPQYYLRHQQPHPSHDCRSRHQRIV